MLAADFDFFLPDERIALYPASPRDAAKMLHCVGKTVSDRAVRDLPGLLRPGDLLVVNDSRVIPAQLRGTRPERSGGAAITIDATLHKRLSADLWRAFVRPAKRVRAGDAVDFGAGLVAIVEARDESEALLRFNLSGDAFDAALAQAGRPPLPPYIARRREPSLTDAADYQTVYADRAGSVAAPTAGLHFTPELLARLDEAGISRETVTLHVGAGTFLPVTADKIKDHVMHAEWGEISPAQASRINAARANGGRIVAVGTTALRLLESAADPSGEVQPFNSATSIFITPGYRFRVVDVLMTNFHLPRSTLFMLVCAFAGVEAMQRAYAHAIAGGYRFYSFGDACLLERQR